MAVAVAVPLAAASRGLRGLLLRRLLAPTQPGLTCSCRPLSSPAQDEASQAAPVKAPGHSYQSLRVTSGPGHILHVQINRPEKRNAMNKAFWSEMVECFNKISEDADCHTVVISGEGKMFTSGIDLMDMASVLLQPQGDDVARISWYMRNLLSKHQETFSVIEKCPKPVIAAIHGGCIGAGVDLITTCDIRYCAQDAFFQVKVNHASLSFSYSGGGHRSGSRRGNPAASAPGHREPEVRGAERRGPQGAPDAGRRPSLTSRPSCSLVNELAFTARRMMADEALSSGLVSRVFPDKEATLDAAFTLAAEISSRSPLAVQGTKVNLVYARDHPVAAGLEFVHNWNMSMLQTDDVLKSVQAAMEKKDLKSVTFSKL